ncbi:DNase I-like protein [Wilcoxina mikolae CBS 423.85]|nr:DNase I-like protein [Wilcoxina mikolae CBS 423.85]
MSSRSPQLTLYLLTLNCARLLQQPPLLSKSLASTLPTTPPTLLLVSLQELAPLSPSFLGGTYVTPYIASFAEGIAAATSSIYGLSYELLGFYNVGLTGVVAFLHPLAAEDVDGVQWAGVGLGVGGMGNKGAVALRLRAGGVEVTVVGAHWAPDEWQAERRDQDWKNLVQNLVFDDGRQIYPKDRNGCLFVMGDLNYRTSDTRPPTGCEFPTPQAGFEAWSEQWKLDQLGKRRREGKTLHHLQEAEVEFPPTYKFEMEHGGYSKRRWPSWTDRILFLPSQVVSVARYDSIQAYNGSDHKPVYAVVEIEVGDEGEGQRGKREWKAPWGVSEGWSRRRVLARQGEMVVGTLWMAGLPGVVFTVVLVILGSVWASKGL